MQGGETVSFMFDLARWAEAGRCFLKMRGLVLTTVGQLVLATEL